MYTQFRLGTGEELEIKASATNWTLHVQSRKPTYTMYIPRPIDIYVHVVHTYIHIIHAIPSHILQKITHYNVPIPNKEERVSKRERERERENKRKRERERVSYVDLEPMILSLFPCTVFGNQCSFVPPPKQAAAASNT